MRNLLLKISYIGSEYHGWQVQDNAVTVQQTLQDAIEKVFGKREDVIGCSRTDAGVHANMFCCNFRTEKDIPVEKVANALNGNLPRDISVLSCEEAKPDFHSRYSCKGKEYVYKIWNGKSRNPFTEGLYYNYPYNIDCEKLQNDCNDFIGTYDFKSFCSVKTTVFDTVRTIYKCEIKRNGDEVLITVKGNGFLYNMVRIIVGTLLEISSGKIRSGTVKDIIFECNREKAGFTAPAHGLYLNSVEY